jgi:hypothetical protein
VVERVGVLYLDLHRRSYTWRFVTTDGRTQDQGSSSL